MAPRLTSRMFVKADPYADPGFYDSADIYQVLNHKCTFNRAKIGQESVIECLANSAKKLVEIALGPTADADKAYRIIQLENSAIIGEIMNQNALVEVSDQIFENASTHRTALMRFTWMTKIALTKCTLQAVKHCNYVHQFARFVDELFVIDLFASLVSMRSNISPVIEEFLIESQLIEHLMSRIAEDEENVYRALGYFGRLDRLRAHISAHVGILIQTPEIGDRETLKCKWNFYTSVLSEDTYPIMKELAGVAAKMILISDTFQQKELYCLEFIGKCCSIDSEFGEHLEGISFIALLFDTLSKMPNNVSFYLCVVQLCLALFKIPVLSKAVAAASIPFAIRRIRERDNDIPLAAISWNYLRLLSNDCPEVNTGLPDDIREWVARVTHLCENNYGGEVPRKTVTSTSSGELTPDELITFFKEVVLARK